MWKTKMASFKPKQVTVSRSERRKGGVSFHHHRMEPGNTLARSMTALPQGYVLVHVVKLKENRVVVTQSYLLATATGEGMYLGETMPRFYASTAEHLLAGALNPFPQVTLFRIPPLSL